MMNKADKNGETVCEIIVISIKNINVNNNKKI